MARLSTVLCTSHTPYLLLPIERWEETRELRARAGGFAPDVPIESRGELEAKQRRMQDALGALRERLRAAAPDVLIVFGDDQSEQFAFRNYPAIATYLGAEFSGFKIAPRDGPIFPGDWPRFARTPDHWATVPGAPPVARALLTTLIDAGFDIAFSQELPDPERGMGHAFMRVHTMLQTGFAIPTVPIWVNCYYGPQPTGARCYALGRAVRAFIESWDEPLRIAVVGSGGLWHTPLHPQSILDETFDHEMLAALERGDAAEMARAFDARTPNVDANDAEAVRTYSGGTGIVTGLGSGTGETRNWIAASAVVDGIPGTVVDYIPLYVSPIGIAFAAWDL